MRPRPSEEGFTLPELLISVSILAIIVAPLTMSFILGLRIVGRADDKFTDSRSSLMMANDFASDVSGANLVTTTGSPAACGSGGTLLVTFAGGDATSDDLTQVKSYTNEVSYFYDATDATNGKLLRRICRRGGAAVTSTPAVHLGDQPTVQCFAAASTTAITCSDPTVRRVQMAVTQAPGLPSPDDPSPTPYTYTLTGSRRSS